MTSTAPRQAWLPQITFGDRVRVVRREFGQSQDEFADRLGVKRVTLSAWESGRNRPDDLLAAARRIQLSTGVPAWWMLGLDEPDLRARGDSNSRPED